jgi:hypothetical protein
LTITFSLKKKDSDDKAADKNEEDKSTGEYEILKNVPDVRIYFGNAKSAKKQVTPIEKSNQQQQKWPKIDYHDDDQHKFQSYI